MKTEKLTEMIDLYFDSELEKGKEPVLFTALSSDPDAREYFKKMNSIQSCIAGSMEEFPLPLDETILLKVGRLDHKRARLSAPQRVFTAIAFSFSIILLAASLFFYSKSEEYKVQLIDLTREVKERNESILSIMNTLPEVEVKGSYLKLKTITVNRERRKGAPILLILPEIEVDESNNKIREVNVTPKI